MAETPDRSFRPLIISMACMILVGWGIFAYVVFMLTPVVWARWLFFFGGVVGLTGLALPVAWFLNLRFPSEPRAGTAVLLRQAIWVGVYGSLLLWLQQERLVTIWSVLGLAAGLVAIEYLIRMRETSRWQPLVKEPGQKLADASGEDQQEVQ